MLNLTLSEENQFSFVCPLFNAETKMSMCMKLRELKWMGKAPLDKRRGCQAAMSCGKCPAAEAVSQIIYSRAKEGMPDFYGSKTPTVGKLRADVLEKVERTMMREDIMNKIGVSDAERTLLDGANDRIRAQLKTAPKGEGHYSPRQSSADPVTTRKRTTTKISREETIVETPPRNDAALTGDMSAALNG